ncbi:MAG: CRTAC1 family protein [Acidimicrobiia bacterium]|nr:CRTAC1 family protein [Acidimicrobiia bacterium]
MSGRFYLAEIMGSGVALLDYDNDGDLDVYAVQGGRLGAGAAADPRGDRLFRNDLTSSADGTRTLRFTDVTDAAGIRPQGYGMGVATGDVDNDGWVDLYRTGLGRAVLLRNTGTGAFEDVSRASGAAGDGWGVSAAFVDYDRDGWLDLYVGNYLLYSVETDTPCFSATGQPDYCAPGTYRPAADRLYRNRGGGRFEDVTARAGIARQTAPALGVLATDVNRDGWPDLYVANDGTPNLLWLNQRNGTFTDTALPSGVAVSGDGRSEGSMGVDAADFDNDGDDDLIVTNIAGEGHALYVDTGGGVFEDRSTPAGLTVATLPYTGFGAAWLDADNDGWLDLLTVNGHIHVLEALARAGDTFPLDQRKQLFRNTRGGRFEDATAAAGPAFEGTSVGRGAAVGDIDNDGDTDVVVSNNDGPLSLLVNHRGNAQHWLGLELRPATGPRGAPGARATIELPDGSRRVRRAHTDGSYASASDPRILIGLGDSAGSLRVRVDWPDGRSETWDSVMADRWTTLTQGTGR